MLVANSFFAKDFLGHWFDHWHSDSEAHFVPQAGIAEQPQEYVLSLDLPGCKKDALQVEVKDKQLIVKGERHHHAKHEHAGCLREERAFGAFERRFVLPESVARNKIAVHYSDGVLQVKMPKSETATARRLAISD